MNRLCRTMFKRLFFQTISFALGVALLAFPAPVFAGGEREITLDEAYRSALEYNERISASRYRVQQAREDVRIARSPMLPQVRLEGRHIRLKESDPAAGFGDLAADFGLDPDAFDFRGPDNYNEASISASQVLFQGGKLRAGYLASQYAAESSEFEDYRLRQQVLFSVSGSFYNVLFARRAMGIAENRLTRSTRHLDLARERYEVGLVDITAMLRAQVQVAAAMEAVEQAKNDYTIAKERLALEMGVAEPPATVKEPEPIEVPEAPVERHIEYAFDNRRDLMASQKGRRLAEKQIDAERADFYPSLSLQGSYTVVDDEAVYGEDKYNWQAALVASYPLFSGFRDTAEVAKARAMESEMKASENRIKQEIRVDVRSAYADIQSRKKVVEHINDQVRAAKANYEQVSAKFEEGLASTVDVVDAETALNEAELSLASVYYQLQLDNLGLKLATGEFLGDYLR